MEAPKLSSMGQVVVATLLAEAVYSLLVVWISLAQIEGGPILATAYVGVLFVLMFVFLLPLAWWGQRSAYLGGIGVGIFGIVANILGIAGVFGTLATESYIAIVPAILVNLALAVAGFMAWRE